MLIKYKLNLSNLTLRNRQQVLSRSPGAKHLL